MFEIGGVRMRASRAMLGLNGGARPCVPYF